MDKKIKCIISRYDETITEPPYLTIKLDEVEVFEPEDTHDDLGARFAYRLEKACKEKGYEFKFNTKSDSDEYDYEIVVYGKMEEQRPSYNDMIRKYIYNKINTIFL